LGKFGNGKFSPPYGGGGIFNDGQSAGAATLTLTNASVNGNTSKTDGGGIEQSGIATATLTYTSVDHNTANINGGGIGNDGVQTFGALSSNATLSLKSSNVTGNTATGDGGGIYNTNDGGTATVNFLDTNTSVNQNTAAAGGGIFNLGTLTGNFTSDVYNNTVGNIAS